MLFPCPTSLLSVVCILLHHHPSPSRPDRCFIFSQTYVALVTHSDEFWCKSQGHHSHSRSACLLYDYHNKIINVRNENYWKDAFLYFWEMSEASTGYPVWTQSGLGRKMLMLKSFPGKGNQIRNTCMEEIFPTWQLWELNQATSQLSECFNQLATDHSHCCKTRGKATPSSWS